MRLCYEGEVEDGEPNYSRVHAATQTGRGVL